MLLVWLFCASASVRTCRFGWPKSSIPRAPALRIGCQGINQVGFCLRLTTTSASGSNKQRWQWRWLLVIFAMVASAVVDPSNVYWLRLAISTSLSSTRRRGCHEQREWVTVRHRIISLLKNLYAWLNKLPSPRKMNAFINKLYGMQSCFFFHGFAD